MTTTTRTRTRSLGFLSASLLGAFLASGCAGQATAQPTTPSSPASPSAASSSSAPVAAPLEPSVTVLGQIPKLPQASPSAAVHQQVGITEIRVDYSSPGAKGRPIWGALVPYNEPWRAGANSPTRITFDREVTVGGTSVPAGTYTIMIVPTASTWTVMLNRDPSKAGVYGYDASQDVAKFSVTPQDAPARERLAYMFEDTSDSGTKLVLDWAAKRVVVDITVDTKAHATANIEGILKLQWRPVFNAGRYVLDSEKNAERALTLFQQSMTIQTNWWNTWWAALSLHELGRHADARKHAEQAASLGKGDATFERAFAPQVTDALATWPKE